jgi:hypothetical protein
VAAPDQILPYAGDEKREAYGISCLWREIGQEIPIRSFVLHIVEAGQNLNGVAKGRMGGDVLHPLAS